MPRWTQSGARCRSSNPRGSGTQHAARDRPIYEYVIEPGDPARKSAQGRGEPTFGLDAVRRILARHGDAVAWREMLTDEDGDPLKFLWAERERIHRTPLRTECLRTLRDRLDSNGTEDALRAAILLGRLGEAPDTPPLMEIVSTAREQDRAGVALQLAEIDTEPAVEFLLRRQPEGPWVRPGETAYALVSALALSLPPGSGEVYIKLQEASRPEVRVAAAVYLMKEDERRGRALLREATKLKGWAGVMVAYSLARRGDKSVVPRLLDVLDHEGPVLEVCHLLANSAGDEVPLPPVRPHDDYDEGHADSVAGIVSALRGWWARHGDRIRLHDSRVEELDRQGLD